MSEVADFKPGLEGVVAVETEIAEPDREGGALRYRGVDIEELVSEHIPYEQVWGLLVDQSLEPGMPEPEPYEPRPSPATPRPTRRPRSRGSPACGACRSSPRSRTSRRGTTSAASRRS